MRLVRVRGHRAGRRKDRRALRALWCPWDAVRGRNSVIGVLDCENSCAPQPNLRHGLIVDWKPKLSEFLVTMVNFCMADPQRWILCRFSLDSDDRVVVSV